MSFWLRELAGWLLVLLGLAAFLYCVQMAEDGKILQLGPMTLIAIIIFRGGIHLLKVAVAARVCLKAREQLASPEKPGKRLTVQTSPIRKG